MTQHVFDLLQSTRTDWGHIVDTVQALRAIREAVFNTLPEDIQPHCQVGHYQKGILTLVASSSARATQIRCISSEVLQKLRQDPKWAAIRSIQIKVESFKPTTIVTDPEPESRPVSTFNAEVATTLSNAAAELDMNKPGNDELKAALERLAQLGEKNV